MPERVHASLTQPCFRTCRSSILERMLVMKSDNHCLVVLLPLLTNGGSALIVRLFEAVCLCLPTSAQAAGHGVRSCTKNANIIGLHQLLIVNADLHGREYHLRDTHDEYLPQVRSYLRSCSTFPRHRACLSLSRSRLTYPAVSCVSLVFVRFGARPFGKRDVPKQMPYENTPVPEQPRGLCWSGRSYDH